MLFHDLRYALRQLRRAPGFSFTVVLTLALSVGAATAVFCVIDTVVLRPLPFVTPDQIVAIQATARAGYTQPASWPSYQDETRQLTTFSALAGYSSFKKITIEAPASGPTAIDCVRSTDNFFQVFGVQPLLGRTYLPGEQLDGRNEIVVLSYDAWQFYFNADRKIIGKPVTLDGRSFTVIGVMPAGFRFPLSEHNEVYIPRLLDESWMQRRGAHWLQTVGRIKDGATVQQAQADLTHVFNDIGRSYPDTDGGRIVKPVLLADSITAKTKGPLWTLLAAVLALLAIGCVNVAGLLLARGVRREHEMAMRVAIGAGRKRLLAQLLTEGVMLAVLGAIGGALLAQGLIIAMRTFLVHALDRGADIRMNWMVLLAAVLAAVAVSLAASLFPAVRLSGIDPNRALKSGDSAGTQRSQARLRTGFVVTQIALTLVLLVVSGLLMRMMTRYAHTDLGFDPNHILSVKIRFLPFHS